MAYFNRSAYTLMEIVVAVAIMGIIALIAVPVIITSRENINEDACDANRAIVDAAIQQWIVANDIADGIGVEANAVGGWEPYIRTSVVPVCPTDDDAYEYGNDQTDDYAVTCPNGH